MCGPCLFVRYYNRPCLVAMLMLDLQAVAHWADGRHVVYLDVRALIECSELRAP